MREIMLVPLLCEDCEIAKRCGVRQNGLLRRRQTSTLNNVPLCLHLCVLPEDALSVIPQVSR